MIKNNQLDQKSENANLGFPNINNTRPQSKSYNQQPVQYYGQQSTPGVIQATINGVMGSQHSNQVVQMQQKQKVSSKQQRRKISQNQPTQQLQQPIPQINYNPQSQLYPGSMKKKSSKGNMIALEMQNAQSPQPNSSSNNYQYRVANFSYSQVTQKQMPLFRQNFNQDQEEVPYFVQQITSFPQQTVNSESFKTKQTKPDFKNSTPGNALLQLSLKNPDDVCQDDNINLMHRKRESGTKQHVGSHSVVQQSKMNKAYIKPPPAYNLLNENAFQNTQALQNKNVLLIENQISGGQARRQIKNVTSDQSSIFQNDLILQKQEQYNHQMLLTQQNQKLRQVLVPTDTQQQLLQTQQSLKQRNGESKLGQQTTVDSIKIKQFQQPLIINQQSILFAHQQPNEKVGQKGTNILVRIDNSTAANHQIIKRKKIKDGALMLSQNSQFVDDPDQQDVMAYYNSSPQEYQKVVEEKEISCFKVESESALLAQDEDLNQSDGDQKRQSKLQKPFSSQTINKTTLQTSVIEKPQVETIIEAEKQTLNRSESAQGRVSSYLLNEHKRSNSQLQKAENLSNNILAVPRIKLVQNKKIDRPFVEDDHIDIEDMDEEEDERYSSCGDQSHQGVDDDMIYGHCENQPVYETAVKNLTQTARNVAASQNLNNENSDQDFEQQSLPFFINKQNSVNVLESDCETDENFSDTGSCFGGSTIAEGGKVRENNYNIDNISEHSSDDEQTDSEEEIDPVSKRPLTKNTEKKAKKKVKEEKGEGAKKKKSKEGQPKEKDGKKKKETGKSEFQSKETNTGRQKREVDQQQVKGSKDQKIKDKNKNIQSNTQNKSSHTTDKNKKTDSKEASFKQVANGIDWNAVSPSKKKKVKQNEKTLVNVRPKNIIEQQELFFANDCKINPVFEYENPQLTQKTLQSYSQASYQYLEIAKAILDSFLETFGSESQYLASEGDKLSQEETETIMTNYIKELGFEEQLVLNFQPNQVAPTSCTYDPKLGKSKINVRIPCEYRRGRIMGVLDHEVGTHFLRRNNERFQAWHKKKEKYEMKSCMATEEGFATINQLIRQTWADNKSPFLYRSALNYYIAYKASQMSFVELFNDIECYIDDKLSRFHYVIRVKRGLEDTSVPGGYYKDQVYLEGAVQILQDRKNLDFHGLCCGKISLEDLRKPHIAKKLKKENITIPPFMLDMERYMQALDIISVVNHIPAI